MSLLYRDDVGASIVIATNNTTIPASTVLTVVVEKPGASVVTWTLDPVTDIDFTTGIITHTTVSGDLDESGEYKVQVHGIFADGDDTRSDIDTFTVHERLG